MTDTRKKVIVRRFSPGLLRGYLPQSGFVAWHNGIPMLELLDLSARVQSIPLQEVSQVSYVREFHSSDDVNPERLPRRTFLGRPRAEGLWVRVGLRESEPIEGLAPLDLALAKGLADDLGIQLTPPDVRGNTQRLYIPRSAMTALQVVAVVTTPSRRKSLERPSSSGVEEAQLALALPESAVDR